MLTFGGIADYLAFHFQKPRGRELVVENLLNKAELFPTMNVEGVAAPHTGDIVSTLVSYNTIAALVPAGVLLVALAVLSVRDLDAVPTRDDLMLRRVCLRVALGVGSALFVIGVLANKALVQWPLSLVSEPQQLALQPIADAVTLQLGTMGTIAIVAAFTPALTAWWLDVQLFEADKAKKAEANKAAKAASEAIAAAGLIPMPGAPPVAAAAGPVASEDDVPSTKKSVSEFAFAPLSLISAIIAALAPMLASPFADTLKSVLTAVGGK